MRHLVFTLAIAVLFPATIWGQDGSWEIMFNGKNLLGWHVNENPESVGVEDGCLVVKGKRAHAFYVGPSGNTNVKDFHFKTKVMTKPGANSGIYFHTRFLATGWPDRGYEAQVNNTQHDKKKTGGLYNVQDNFEPAFKKYEKETVRGERTDP